MTAAQLLQLFLLLGPGAFRLIDSLMAVWTKPTLSIEEVQAICSVARASYDDYKRAGGGPPVADAGPLATGAVFTAEVQSIKTP